MATTSMDALVALSPTGVLRVGMNIANLAVVQVAADGSLTGQSVDLAHRLGTRLGRPVKLVHYSSAGLLMDSLNADAWDVTFLAVDPARAKHLHFTPAYCVIRATIVVMAEKPWERIGDIDAPDVRIASSRGAAYDLHLQRTFSHAERVSYDTPGHALAALRDGQVDAAAGVRPVLEAFMSSHAGYRVLEEDLLRINHAMAIRHGNPAGAAFLDRFIEEEIEQSRNRERPPQYERVSKDQA